MKTKAAVQMRMGEPLKILDVDLEEPRENEVLVRIVACGICHTDIMMQHASSYYPYLLGHEGSGIVERIGKQVDLVKVGDHVVISYTHCDQCSSCKAGKPYECENLYDPFFLGYRLDGATPNSIYGKPIPTLIGQGSFSEYVVVNANSLVKVDKELDLRILSPLGCGIMTGAGAIYHYLQVKEGSSILISGLGGVGLGALMTAKILGCKTIIAIDRNDERLQLAQELGATHSININECNDMKRKIMNISSNIDYAYDTTGSESILEVLNGVLNSSSKACGAGGGYIDGFQWTIVDEGHTIPQIFIPKMIEWYKKGAFPIEKMICFFPFEKVNEAMTALKANTVIKPVLLW